MQSWSGFAANGAPPCEELAASSSKDHIVAMAGKSTDSAKRGSTGKDRKILGRSALTGRYVMKPATKSSVSSKKLKSAVRAASREKR
jgi:hypothetical protein